MKKYYMTIFVINWPMMTRLEREKLTLERMIRLYCRVREGNETLCPGCEELLTYALSRLDRCPHAECKPTCKDCTTHCYRQDMRLRIKRVMRFSGPRLIWYYPGAAIRHMLGK